VGPADRLVGAFPANPKGFFEFRRQDIFLEVAYPHAYPDPEAPPDLEQLDRKGAVHAEAYRKLLAYEFDAEFPIAIKSQRMLTLPLLHELQDVFETRVLVLDRDIEDQSRSIRRVWRKAEVRQQWTLDDIKSLLDSWKNFRDRVCECYDFPMLRVQFEDVIHRPCKTTRMITDFLEVPCPSDRKIQNWIDPDLANRDNLKGTGPSSGIFRRACRKVGRLLLSYGKPDR